MTAGNCVAAFKNCHSDSNCRSRLSHLLSECSFGGLSGHPASSSSHGPQPQRNATQCNRRACQEAFRAFFLLVRPERTQGLLFCRCPKHPAVDERCETVRRALSPPCALVELPPPTCLDLADRCRSSNECRYRREYMYTHEYTMIQRFKHATYKHCTYKIHVARRGVVEGGRRPLTPLCKMIHCDSLY